MLLPVRANIPTYYFFKRLRYSTNDRSSPRWDLSAGTLSPRCAAKRSALGTYREEMDNFAGP